MPPHSAPRPPDEPRRPDSYSATRIKSALGHFLVGKPVSAAGNVLFTLLAARELPVEDYATYAVMLGLVTIVAMAFSFGIQDSVQRFAPELAVRERTRQLRRFTLGSVLARLLSTLPAAAAISLAAGPLCSTLGLGDHVHELRLWALVTVLVVLGRFMVVLLETFLMQRATKWLAIINAAMRLGGLLTCMALAAPVSLIQIVWIEGAAHLCTCALALWATLRVLAKRTRGCAPGGEEPGLLSRCVRYGAYNWLRSIVQLLGGRAVDKLVVARFSPLGATASFGFAESLYGMAERHTPSFLLWNLIAPALMGRYAADGDAARLNRTSNLLFKINLLLLGPVIAWLAIMGDTATGLLSKGKYPDAGWMLLLLMAVLVMKAHHQILFALANATERSRDLFLANIWPAAFVVPGILGIWMVGVGGLLAMRVAGQAARDVFLARRLARQGTPYTPDLRGMARLGLCLAACLPLGLATPADPGWGALLLMAGLCCLVFWTAALVLRPLDADELRSIGALLGDKIPVDRLVRRVRGMGRKP